MLRSSSRHIKVKRGHRLVGRVSAVVNLHRSKNALLRPGRYSMWLSSCSLRRSVFCLLTLWTIAPACIAQAKPQFTQPLVEPTNGIVNSFLFGNFETIASTDLLYIDDATNNAGTWQVTVGELLNQPSYLDLDQNRIVLSNTLSVSAALADFNADNRTDYAFALSPTLPGGNDLCVYYGTGLGAVYPGSYALSASDCISFPIHGTNLPSFSYIAALPFKTGFLPQLLLEDSNNGYLYVLANTGAVGSNGLPGFSVKSVYVIPVADGPGPIYTGDFNGDGNTDFIVNNQTSLSASIYFGNGDGTFQPPVKVAGIGNVHSMLLHDMDGDNIADLVVEGDSGVITIHYGSGSNTPAAFSPVSAGGSLPLQNGFSGNGGHLAAIGYLGAHNILSILTTTPIGLSVLQPSVTGLQSYRLAGIYNIGPGRSSFSLADYNGDGVADLAVDSPQGIAVVLGTAAGGFQTSLAYPAGQPALNATLADFNNDGKLDVAVATGTTQAQVLTGNGDGTFKTLPAPTNTVPSPNPTLWSAVLTGDFDGDGKQDLLYSLTGLPLPTPNANAGTGLYLQYGNGDGTFQPPVPISNQLLGAPANNNFYGESAVADLNGDGIPDIINLDTYFYDTLLSQLRGGGFRIGLNIQEDAGAANENAELDSFSQVATGVFAGKRTVQQDLVFQDDANITPYVNSGDGVNFTAMHALASPPPIGSYYGGTILIADVDNDGCGDIVIPYHNLASNPASPNPNFPNQLYVWYGNCDGTFADPPVITTLARNYYLAAVADMNGDGLPDIVLSDGYVLAILYNQGNRSFNGEQDFLAGQGINSISVVDINGDGSPDIIVSNGGATISGAVAIGGLTLPSISLTPNPGVNTGGITVLLNNITTKAVTGNLLVTPDPSQAQAPFTITAALTPASGVPLPTGSVQFAINGINLGIAVPVVPGSVSSTAAYTVPAGNTYAAGLTYAITAMYSGDSFNSPLTLHATQVITGIPTTTTLDLCIGGSTPNCPVAGTPTGLTFVPSLTMFYGQVYNGTEAVTDTDLTAFTGTGTLDFYQDGILLCTLPATGAASCPPSVGMGTNVGTHTFISEYSGDATHTTSNSQPVNITVLQDTTSATLTGAPNPSPFGQPVTFTATFTGSFAPPTGTVTFIELFPPTALATQLGTATLVPGTGLSSTATFTTSTLPVGTDTIEASYSGNPNFAPANTGTTETILPLATSTTTLTSSINPSGIGQSVTFTATVKASAPSGAPPTPAGTVTFLDGTTTIGTGVLNGSGVATFTTSTLTTGSHNITASYPGTMSLGGSVSAILVQVVNNSSFSITVTPTPITVAVGNAVTLTVTINPLSGFNQTVKLGCSNLPNESACTFAAPTLASGSYTTTLLLSTIAPHNCDSTQPYFTGSNTPSPGQPPLAPFVIPALAGLAAIFIPGRRRWLRALIATAAIATAMQISGCGNCTDLGTRPNTYTFQVYGAATGTAEIESQSVTITVTI